VEVAVEDASFSTPIAEKAGKSTFDCRIAIFTFRGETRPICEHAQTNHLAVVHFGQRPASRSAGGSERPLTLETPLEFVAHFGQPLLCGLSGREMIVRHTFPLVPVEEKGVASPCRPSA
jgi:hypothetical protein